MWFPLALASAVFAGFVSVLGKRGLKTVPSNLATALRSVVALLLSWVLVYFTGVYPGLAKLDASTLFVLVLSGLATGASWLMYFKALQLGTVTQVVAVDRTSLLVTGLAAIVLLGETGNLGFKLTGLALVFFGTLIVIWKRSGDTSVSFAWLPWALGSMVFAVVTTLLAKSALAAVDSTLATAIRTAVVVLVSLGIAGARGELSQLRTIDSRSARFLVLSGLATGFSWLCYFGALKLGEVSAVAPIDKLSIVFAAVFAWLFLREKVSRNAILGILVMVTGTLVLLL